jgi:hypothetical protein
LTLGRSMTGADSAIPEAGLAGLEAVSGLFSDSGESKSDAEDFAKWAEVFGAAVLAARNFALSPTFCDSSKSRALIFGELMAGVSAVASRVLACLQAVSRGG